jgi:hypothetical protein
MNASIGRVECPMVITNNGIAVARCFIKTSDCSPSSMSGATKRPPENVVATRMLEVCCCSLASCCRTERMP